MVMLLYQTSIVSIQLLIPLNGTKVGRREKYRRHSLLDIIDPVEQTMPTDATETLTIWIARPPYKDRLTHDMIFWNKAPVTTEIYGKVFYLAHGDGLGDPDNKFKFLRKVFHNRTCQRLLNFVHPRWGMALGLNWAKHSRLKRADGKEAPFMGEDKEYLVRFAREYKHSHPNIDFFLFGHRHIELDLSIDKTTRMLILGDWIWQFTYAVFDGEHLFLGEYVEGESKF